MIRVLNGAEFAEWPDGSLVYTGPNRLPYFIKIQSNGNITPGWYGIIYDHKADEVRLKTPAYYDLPDVVQDMRSRGWDL